MTFGQGQAVPFARDWGALQGEDMRLLTVLALVASGFASTAFGEEALDPVDQRALNAMPRSEAFLHAFEAGDELTEFSFTAAQGVGANIGEGRRFTRFPRADLIGPEDWASHFPLREGGANATSCIACHNAPFANGAGDVALNVVVDPAHTGDPSKYLERNTLPLFALGIPQRLAEEMSQELYLQRADAVAQACADGSAVAPLSAKGVEFGTLGVTRIATDPCEVKFETAGLDGIDGDLVIKPFGWKGNHATIRSFTRSAAHNELGLQAVELVGDRDGDFDGVTGELSVGDMTALTIYMAALERPVSTIELADLGLMEMSDAARSDILAGQARFAEAQCSSCHLPRMILSDPYFREPSAVPGFFDTPFPDGSDPAAHGVANAHAITFDLTKDQPNNRIATGTGGDDLLGALETGDDGAGIARWYTDFKRHDMGPDLADPDDPLGIPAAEFLTRSLAGVAVTGPWLHDGRATTLAEAIDAHGGEAADSAAHFRTMPTAEQAQLIAFLQSLVMFQSEEAH